MYLVKLSKDKDVFQMAQIQVMFVQVVLEHNGQQPFKCGNEYFTQLLW